MLRTLICLGLLLVGPLAAEQIDNIIFSLPTSQKWVIQDDVMNSFGHATIYAPLEENNEAGDMYVLWDLLSDDEEEIVVDDNDRFQHLIAQAFHIPFVKDNPEDFEKWMQIAFPFLEMHCQLVESTDDSITVELFGYDEGALDLYSVIRKIRSKEGTVLLTYACDAEGLSDEGLERVKDVWIPLMLNACQVN